MAKKDKLTKKQKEELQKLTDEMMKLSIEVVEDYELLKKAKEQMERLNKTGKEYNPAPKESKGGEKKIQ